MLTTVHIEKDVKKFLRVLEEPTKESSMVWVKWRVADYQTLAEIEDDSRRFPEPGQPYYVVDMALEEELIWKRLLHKASWFKAEHDGEEVKEEQYEIQVLGLDPRVSNALIKPMIEGLFISEKEGKELYKQCCTLFAPESRGLTYPNKWIRKYCELTAFWKEFGLNRFDLENMPQPEALRLKRIASIGVERHDFERRAAENRAKARARSKR